MGKRIPLRANGGQKAFRHIVVKVIIGRVTQVWPYRAGPGLAYTEDQMLQTIDEMIEKLDAEYPRIDFRMVRVGQHQVTFIAEKVRGNGPETGRGSGQQGDNAGGVAGNIDGTDKDSSGRPDAGSGEETEPSETHAAAVSGADSAASSAA